MQNIAEAFTYQFKDKKYLNKFILGSLFTFLSFLIIPIPFLIGYTVLNIKNIIDKKEFPMPEWKDLGKMYVSGIKFFIYCIGYFIPAFCIIFLSIAVAFLPMLFEDSDITVLFIIPMFFVQGLSMVYSMLMQLISPVLYIKYAKGEPMKNFYQFKNIYLYIKNNFIHIILAYVVVMAAGFIASFSMLLFFIGILPGIFYSMTVMAYIYAQVELQAKKQASIV